MENLTFEVIQPFVGTINGIVFTNEPIYSTMKVILERLVEEQGFKEIPTDFIQDLGNALYMLSVEENNPIRYIEDELFDQACSADLKFTFEKSQNHFELINYKLKFKKYKFN